MKDRCYNKKCHAYMDYGGRGVTVCDEWMGNFLSFYDWSIKNGYTDSLTLDRIDVNGNYEPSNCRWATWKTQQNNKRNSKYLRYKGITKTMSEWSRELKIPTSTINNRLLKGYSDEEALSKPVRKQNRGKVYSFKGESHTLVEWSKILDIKRNTLYLRLYNSWTTEEAFTGIKNGVKY